MADVDTNSSGKRGTLTEIEVEKLKEIGDKKRLFDKEYIKLTNRFEQALITHKLAADYYGFRSFWLNFLPLTIISSLITIIGFLIPGDETSSIATGEDESSNVISYTFFSNKFTPKTLSILVGVLGSIATLLTTIANYCAYQSQYDMHISAVKSLGKICLSVDFERDWFSRKATLEFMKRTARKRANNPDEEQDDLDNLLGSDLKSHQSAFKAMQEACDSELPARVIQAFTILENVSCAYTVDGTTDPNLVYFMHKLWKEFSTSFFWPLFQPEINVVLKYKVWMEEKEMLESIEEEDVPPAARESGTTTTYGSVEEG